VAAAVLAASGLGAGAARPAFPATGAASGIGEELAGTTDAGTLRCTTAPVTTGVAGGADAGAAWGAGAGDGDTGALAWVSAALTAARAVAGTAGASGSAMTAVTAEGTPGTAVAARAPAGVHRAAMRSARANAHVTRCPNNFRNVRSTMISFLSLYVSARALSDPKSGPNSCYLWYFHS
jgi:hypothetical protein